MNEHNSIKFLKDSIQKYKKYFCFSLDLCRAINLKDKGVNWYKIPILSFTNIGSGDGSVMIKLPEVRIDKKTISMCSFNKPYQLFNVFKYWTNSKFDRQFQCVVDRDDRRDK